MKKTNRRLVQFTTRGVLVVMAFTAVILVVILNRYRERRVAVEAIDHYHGTYSISVEGPSLITSFFSDKRMFYDLGRVSFGASRPGHDPMNLFDDNALQDVVPFLNRFPSFYKLGLDGASITDSGLMHLTKLKNLRSLYLDMTLVTDAGLQTLSKIDSLERVTLTGTAVTADGVASLRTLLPGCEVVWEPIPN